MYISFTEDGRIGATTEYKEYASDDMIEFDLPDDFDFSKQSEYRIQGGKLTHDPEPPNDEVLAVATQSLQREQETNLARLMVTRVVATLSDEEAESISAFIPEWTVGEVYAEDAVVRYRGALYRLLKTTTAVSQYPPDADISSYKRIGKPNEAGIYPWDQPLGATDAYMKDEKVTYNGKTWVSDIDNNVWAPGVYGWCEACASSVTPDPEPKDPSKPSTPTYPEWVQPTGAHDAYSIHAIVSYNDKLYISTIANNVWAPGIYGWSEYVAE